MTNLPVPEGWEEIEEGGDKYFATECGFTVNGEEVKISNIETSMNEIKLYLQDEVFKT